MPIKKVKTQNSKSKIEKESTKQIKNKKIVTIKNTSLNSNQTQSYTQSKLKDKSKLAWNKFKQPKIFIPVILIIILILAAIFGQKLLFVAYVNGQPITRMAYYNELEKKDGAQVLQNLVVETLINQEAAKKGIVVTNTDVQNAERTIDSQLKSQGEDLNTVLAQQGMTKSDFEEQLKIQQQVEKLLGSKITITDKQIDDYIAQNKDSLPPTATGSALRAQVKQQLEQQELTAQFQSFITTLQQNAHITYFTNYK